MHGHMVWFCKVLASGILIEVEAVRRLPLEREGSVPIVCIEAPLRVAHGSVLLYSGNFSQSSWT